MKQGGMCFYDFDDTIPVINVYFATHGSREVSDFEDDFFVEAFGGEKRIALLERHFDRLKSRGVELSIVSFSWDAVIRESLARVGLRNYFEEDLIFGSDSGAMVKNRLVKGAVIREQMVLRDCVFERAVLVDDDWDNLEVCEREKICRTVHISLARGMNEEDFEVIEGLFG